MDIIYSESNLPYKNIQVCLLVYEFIQENKVLAIGHILVFVLEMQFEIF